MTSDQKKTLRYWILGVIIISRLWFFIPQYLPQLVPEALHNSIWLDICVQVGLQSTHLLITHQFIDPLILGLITFLIGVILCIPGGRLTGIITVLWAPGFFMGIAWVLLYQQNGNKLLFRFLDAINTLGKFFSWAVLGISGFSILYFFILGIKSHLKNVRD